MNKSKSNYQVIAIVGPTASGKSSLAMMIAEILKSEIISADSMQVYRGMDIGTAKVEKSVCSKIKHHLIDVTSINVAFNAVKFQKLSRKSIDKLLSHNKTPIIVGGSGLYIKSAIYDVEYSSISVDDKYKEYLDDNYINNGLKWLQDELRKKDKKAFESIDINNSRRLISALTIIKSTKQPLEKSRVEKEQKLDFHYKTQLIGLTLPREMLYKRINSRVDDMLKDGLLEETKNYLI